MSAMRVSTVKTHAEHLATEPMIFTAPFGNLIENLISANENVSTEGYPQQKPETTLSARGQLKEAIVEYLKDHGKSNRKEIAEALDQCPRYMSIVLNELKRYGRVKMHGGRNTFWTAL